ncbi:hypothetical protein EHS25_003738 [Saitozyma podzolica]|jgi:hypothetical protein|uniref:Uncharacterized protein n=1 Tax=Saitozyma podzolica TaxID=1890683 RepID=A0A427Y3E9_9TREE|nr:hypothetical protein EHS25_003738 [Saitozyma podzolica]
MSSSTSSSPTSRATVYIAFTQILKKSPDGSKSKFVPAIWYDDQYTAGEAPSSELQERAKKLRSMIISKQPDDNGSPEYQSDLQNAEDAPTITFTKAMSDGWIKSAREAVGCDTSDIEVKVCSMAEYLSDLPSYYRFETTPSTSDATHQVGQ